MLSGAPCRTRYSSPALISSHGAAGPSYSILRRESVLVSSGIPYVPCNLHLRRIAGANPLPCAVTKLKNFISRGICTYRNEHPARWSSRPSAKVTNRMSFCRSAKSSRERWKSPSGHVLPCQHPLQPSWNVHLRNPRLYPQQNVHLQKRGRGWGPPWSCPLSLFLLLLPAI